MHFLQQLPESLRLVIEGVRISVWHARPRSDMNGIESNADVAELRKLLDQADADVLLVGHTHEPFCRTLGDGRVVANPGSLLRDPASRDTGIPCPGTFAVLELPSRRFRIYRAKDGSEL